jgi:UDP-N-acetyl-2-amino-2-deoxyglucuronate dehydrogenase
LSRQTGIGIVGLGLAVKPHALALRDLAGKLRVVGGYSPSAERRHAFSAAWDLPAADSIEALLGDPDVDVLLVLTPPLTHAELALQAAQAGKHVLLEKPVDVTLPRARAVVEEVARAGVKLGVVFSTASVPAPASCASASPRARWAICCPFPPRSDGGARPSTTRSLAAA